MAESRSQTGELNVRSLERDGIIWVVVERPTDREMAWLRERCGIIHLQMGRIGLPNAPVIWQRIDELGGEGS